MHGNYRGLLHILSETIMPVLPLLKRPSSPKRHPEAHSLKARHLLHPPLTFSIRDGVLCEALVYAADNGGPLAMHLPPRHH